ncbi:MAG TPA: translocation/assembly module TamB domain-containing protein [Flavobacteriaceae bacterium]|nr:translocation/assembly module TamB domain-containing protein [Flavobacteriaceae bacterium]
MEQEFKKKKSIGHKLLVLLGWALVATLITIFLLLLFIRTPWGQNVIVQRAVKYVSNKTHTEVAIDKLFITFDGKVILKDFYLEDEKGDTLIYSRSLELDVPILPILKGNTISINSVDWRGLKANIVQNDTLEGYNFQFLIDAFASGDETQTEGTDKQDKPLKFNLGTIYLQDFDVTYKDVATGINSKIKFAELDLGFDKIDLENMDFRLSNTYLTDANIQLHQTSVVGIAESEGTSTLPYLVLDKLGFSNVMMEYTSEETGMIANLNLGDLYLELPKADIANKAVFVEMLRLTNTNIDVKSYKDKPKSIEPKLAETTSDTFTWPDLILEVKEIDLRNNNLSYVVNDAEVKKDVFNSNALLINDFTLQAKGVFLKDKTAGIQLNALHFKEQSGIHLKEFKVDLAANDQEIKLNELKLLLNNNRVAGNVSTTYTSLAKFIEDPERASVALNLPNFQLDIRDAFRFNPDLRTNESILALSRKYVRGSVNAAGSLSNLRVPKASVSWGNTRLDAVASLKNITNPKTLSFDVTKFRGTTKKQDLLVFVDEEELGLDLPEDISLVGNAKGNRSNLAVNAELITSQGNAIAKGHWINEKGIDFSADVEIIEYKLNELLKNDALGTLSFKLQTNGSGDDINHLDMDLDANLIHFSINEYPIDDLNFVANIKDGEGNLKSIYKDKNLDLELDSYVEFDSISPKANIHLNLIGANLNNLGLSDRDIRTAFVLDADFEGNKDAYDIIATIGDGVFVYDDHTYLLGDVLATAHVESDTTSIWFDNKIARLRLESNAVPEDIFTSIKSYVTSYFSRIQPVLLEDKKPVKMLVKGEINEDPILNKILLRRVEKLDTIKIDVDYDEADRRLIAEVIAPLVIFDGSELHNLKFDMKAIKEDFDFDLGFDNIKSGPFDLPITHIYGEQRDKDLYLNFNAIHNGEYFLSLPSILSGTSEELRLHVPPEDIILNGEQWHIPISNEVRINKEQLVFKDFIFSKGNNSVSYTNDLIETEDAQVAVSFSNFNIKEILNYLNPEETFAEGELNGSFALINPFKTPGIIADLAISNLSVFNSDLGVLSLNAESIGTDTYDFALALEEGLIDLNLDGGYYTIGDSPEVDLKLALNKFDVEALDGFTMGEIRDGKGSFSGNFNVFGPINDLTYAGNLDFAEVDFTVTKLNAPFSLINTSLKIDNKGLYFDTFKVYDEVKNALTVDGIIGTESFSNPTFDLKVLSDNFHLINATVDDNDFLYGVAAVDLDATIKGSLSFPIVNMKARVSDDTDITYVMTSANASMESRDGIIEFVNRQDPDAVLTAKDKDRKAKAISGIDLNASLKIGRQAKVNIILNEDTGDNFRAFGDGEFQFSIKPNGSMLLNGVYNVVGGHYEMNLYNLVNRRFELVEGGRVTWTGNIMDADLDVKARYDVDASASPLMAAVSSGADQTTQNRYRQVLPFFVYLNIGGEITRPDISFNLDMPEDEHGAVGGQVYGRVQQLNQQEDELNRQVFSLLVMNRFFPNAGSDGSEGGLAFIVRNNLNDAISDQLNAFSDKLLGSSGIELDFGLESYTDYQGDAPQDRTQLDIAAQKKLFDDRLIMRVGSEVDLIGSSPTGDEPAPLIGNVSLEYLLTPNGRYSLRAFRKNTFDNIIDGQLVVNGIALIFTQEFNEYRELWQAIMRGETKEEREQRRAAKEAEKQKELEKKELEKIKRSKAESVIKETEVK